MRLRAAGSSALSLLLFARLRLVVRHPLPSHLEVWRSRSAYSSGVILWYFLFFAKLALQ